MVDPLKILSFARQIQRALPPGLRAIKTVVTQGGRRWLQGQFAQFDLVDRQQFEQQQQQLQQLREQLVHLEQQIAHLERQSDTVFPKNPLT